MSDLAGSTGIIKFIAGLDPKSSKQQLRKDVKIVQKMIADVTKVQMSVDIPDAEFKRIKGKFASLTNQVSIDNAELKNITAKAINVLDEEGNTIERLARVTATYRNEQGLQIKSHQMINREMLETANIQNQVTSDTQMSAQKFKEYSEQLRVAKLRATALNNVIKQFGGEDHHADAERLNKDIQKLGINADMSENEVKSLNKQLQIMQKEMQIVSTEARSQGKASLSFGNQMKNAFKGFGIWSAVTVLWYAMVRGVKAMVKEVKELDDAMVEFNKVTNLSETELERFRGTAIKVGETLNTTGSKAIQASADFARMGFSASESLKLAESAIVLTKIADGITEVGEASTAMISIMKGFNLQASESTYVIDALNEVSNNFAINTDDLADGLRRTAGVMKETGVTFEETIGLLVAGQESLQNIEKVSSGLITITTRLRGVAESGEEIDGLMPKLTEAFREYAGIDIQGQNGDLKNTSDILAELKPKWGLLNDEQRAYLSFLISGTRQSPVLLAMMSNLENGAEATATATNSAGSAMEEFGKYSNSLQGKLDKLGATWSRISTNFLSSEFLGGLLNIANVLSFVFEKLGGITGLLMAMSPAMGVVANITKSKQAWTDWLEYGTTSKKAIGIQELTESLLGLEEAERSVEELRTDKIKTDLDELKELLDYDDAIEGIKRLEESFDPDNGFVPKGVIKDLERLREKIEPVTKVLAKMKEEEDASTRASYEFMSAFRKQQDVLREAQEETTRTMYKFYGAFREGEDVTKSVAKANRDFGDALKELIEQGDISEYTFNRMANSQETVQFALEATSADVEKLAMAYGYSASDIESIQVQLTNVLIQQTRKRMLAIATEYLALQEQADAIMNSGGELTPIEQRSLYGSGRSLGEAMMNMDKYTARLDEIDSWHAEVSKKTKDSTDNTKEYSRELEKLIALEYELALLEKQKPEAYEEQKAKIKEIQAELSSLNDKDRELLANMKEGTQEYADLLAVINGRSLEWLGYQDKIKDVISEQVELQKESVDTYSSRIVEALNEELVLLGKAKEEWKDTYDIKQKGLDEEINKLKDKKSIEADSVKLAKLELSLLEEKLRLANIKKEENIKILGANGWEFVANEQNILESEKKIADITKSIEELKAEQAYQAQIKQLEQQKAYWTEEARLTDEGLSVKEELVKGSISDIESWESLSYAQRLNALVGFVNEHNALYASLKNVDGSSATSSKPSSNNVTTVAMKTSDSVKANKLQEMANNSTAWWDASKEEREYLASENQRIGKELGISDSFDAKTGEWKGVLQYEKGGDIKKDGMVYAHNGEGVLTKDMNQAFKTLVSNTTGVKIPGALSGGRDIMTSSESVTINELNLQVPNNTSLANMLKEAKNMVLSGRIRG